MSLETSTVAGLGRSSTRRPPALEAIGVTKHFGVAGGAGRRVAEAARGTLHALLGENGAGKSTLVKCIMGYYPADDGQVLVNGVAATSRTRATPQALGIGMVYQHFTLVAT